VVIQPEFYGFKTLMVLPPLSKGPQRIKPTIRVFAMDITREIDRQALVSISRNVEIISIWQLATQDRPIST
jgi:hypothetical protein